MFRVILSDVLPKLGFNFDDAWNIVMAISFPIVLIAAEFWIRLMRPKKSVPA